MWNILRNWFALRPKQFKEAQSVPERDWHVFEAENLERFRQASDPLASADLLRELLESEGMRLGLEFRGI